MFAILSIIVLLLLIYPKKENLIENNKIYDGVCAFDLDGTITCGIENARKAINICRTNNYKIAINTARPAKYYSDLKLDLLDLKYEEFGDDFYHGEINLCSFIDYNCMTNNISDIKVKHLETLAEKWKVNPKNVILLDDQHYNIDKAKNKGFSTIHANNPICGLPDNVDKQIENIIALGKRL
jgi:hypothetical protein